MFPWFANYPRTTWTINHMTEDAKYGDVEWTEWTEWSDDGDDGDELLIVYCLIEKFGVWN